MQDENEEENPLSMSVDTGMQYMARNQSSNISYTMEPVQRQTDSAKNIKVFVPGKIIPEQYIESEDQSVRHRDSKEQTEQSIRTVAWSTPSSTVTD